MTETANFSFKLGRKMSKKSIQKMGEKEIQQKIKRLEKNKQDIETKIKKLQDRLKELERNSASSAEKTEEYFTDASQRNGKTKIAIYSPTKDIKQAKQIANCNIVQAEFSAILWAFNQAISNKENAIIYNDSSSSIEKAKKDVENPPIFKGLYGTELTLVDDTVNIVVRPKDIPLL